MTVTDDLGALMDRHHEIRRVVSLVPSLTEALASAKPEAVIGATDWCTHPPDLDAQRVRGTKNPDVARIIDLEPDLVIANKEENREIDVRRLRDAGIPVWVTDIETLDQAFDSLERLFDVGLGWPQPTWLAQARRMWSAPPPSTPLRVVVPIWRDPWMIVGQQTFTADFLRRLGCDVVTLDGTGRYPAVDLDVIDAAGADVVLLPDEPYAFTETDGPEAFATTPTQLVSGRLLTWYGPSLVPARTHLELALDRWRSPTH